MTEPAATVQPNSKMSPGWIVALLLVPVGMLVVALFVLPQMYQFWCRISGTQQRPNNPAAAAAPSVHTGRFIKVFFEATVCDDLPVRFWADKSSEDVEVGVDGRNTYHFHNLSDHVIHFRPIHYISPIRASMEFGMKVCFCFQDRVMQPGETKEYPVVYTFAPALDQRIHTVSICYSLFKRDDTESETDLTKRIEAAVGEKGGVVSPRKAPEPEPQPATPAVPTAPATAAPATEPSGGNPP